MPTMRNCSERLQTRRFEWWKQIKNPVHINWNSKSLAKELWSGGLALPGAEPWASSNLYRCHVTRNIQYDLKKINNITLFKFTNMCKSWKINNTYHKARFKDENSTPMWDEYESDWTKRDVSRHNFSREHMISR